MDVHVYNENGKSIKNQKGELICKNAFSIYAYKVLNDKQNKKYKLAYFTKFPHVWHHGDFAKKLRIIVL